MPLNNLQDIIDAIMGGTQAEKIAFAELIVQAQAFLDKRDSDAAAAQRAIDLGIVNDWWDATIKPTLVWNNSQSLIDQRVNILIDYNNVKLLLDTETDKFRLFVIREKLEQANEKFKQIKAAL